jgi:hypothetical protein
MDVISRGTLLSALGSNFDRHIEHHPKFINYLLVYN